VEVELYRPPNSVTLQEVTSDVGPIGSRTRSTGRAENISIKTINEERNYGLLSEQYGKIFLIFYYHVHIFLKKKKMFFLPKAPYSASVSGLRK
jgi:hypothetical protein